MEENKLIDGAEYIALEDVKRRAGVIVMGISPDNGIQTNFNDYDAERHEKMKRLDEAIDKINREYGSETIVLGSQQYTKPGGKGKADVFKDSIKHEPKEQREQSQTRLSFAESRLRKSNAQFRSPCYTTRWSDIPEAE